MGWKQWTRERLSSSDLQAFLQDQVILRFTSASQRAAQVPAPTQGMTSYLDDLRQYQSRWPDGTWRDLVRPAIGKMWRTSGALTSPLVQNADTRVGMEGSRVSGGFTFTDTTDTLTVPLDGLYDLDACVYWTGSSSWYATSFVYRIRNAVPNLAVAASDLHLHAGTIDARSCYGNQQVPLKAGDQLGLNVFLYTGGSVDAKIGGSANEAQTCWMTASYVGPLNGATPL